MVRVFSKVNVLICFYYKDLTFKIVKKICCKVLQSWCPMYKYCNKYRYLINDNHDNFKDWPM